jgi:uncharacterized membrane protein YbaN (DUF454 family)
VKALSGFNLYVLCGWISFVLGVVGMFVPLLPTVPFFLFTSWCFSRGSPKFHAWILSHQYAGPIIKDWEEYKRISPSVKKKAIILILVSFGISIALIESLLFRSALVILMISVSLFILTRKSK